MVRNKTFSARLADAAILLLMLAISFISLAPVLHTVAVSFSDNAKAAGITIYTVHVSTGSPPDPVSQVLQYCASSTDKFFLVVLSNDPKFDPHRTRAFLRSLDPIRIDAVGQTEEPE